MKDKKYFCIVGIDLYDNSDSCGCCWDTSTINRLRCWMNENPEHDFREVVRGHGTIETLSFKQLLDLRNADDFNKISEKDNTFYYCSNLSERQINFFQNKTDLDCYKATVILE